MNYTKSLTKPPESFNDLNKWADYLEILCLSSEDKIITRDEIYDKLYGDKSDDETSIQTNELEDEDSRNEIEEYKSETNGEKVDNRLSKIGDIFEFLISRKALYEKQYPFLVTIAPKTIALKKDVSFKQYSYLGLLLSANLDYFSYFKPELTTNFEINSMHVFKKLFPIDANVEYFGKGALRGNIFSQNKLIDRIKKLAEVLNLKLSARFDEQEVGHSNTGDGGLDLIGWYDIFDDNNGKIVNFGQCACGKDWYNKQFDIHIAKWKNYIDTTHPILTTLITPTSYRKYDGSWYNNMKVYDCIIIDRLRFIRALTKKENSKVSFVNMAMVQKVMAIEMKYFS